MRGMGEFWMLSSGSGGHWVGWLESGEGAKEGVMGERDEELVNGRTTDEDEDFTLKALKMLLIVPPFGGGTDGPPGFDDEGGEGSTGPPVFIEEEWGDSPWAGWGWESGGLAATGSAIVEGNSAPTEVST
ncbi:hypothetical protein QJS04_geneDACA021618 [Acorus gramineus]|uniref:Uncharacterized protein n=1 Tax=Acorus gramineus TaxID=55184 RepID=A0AAV9B1Q5_ACOGR|nr:hypothetical protein QJS04_geneDACA021618 [Acorus gramineus]